MPLRFTRRVSPHPKASRSEAIRLVEKALGKR
jgi:hypothetical protein